jgi:hypothetical protein
LIVWAETMPVSMSHMDEDNTIARMRGMKNQNQFGLIQPSMNLDAAGLARRWSREYWC